MCLSVDLNYLDIRIILIDKISLVEHNKLMIDVSADVFKKLNKSDASSHKGDNGRVLVIAGSDKYHGALLLSVQAASRIVDMVYVHSVESNMPLVQKLKSEVATFIMVTNEELWETVGLSDVVMVGPGLEESEENKALVKRLLKDYPNEKVVIDATAFWHVDPKLLHENCIVTPHTREFENTFQCEAKADNVLLMAEKFGCTIVLTGPTDYISNGKGVYENKTGNVGMTKGGTGDVLVGLVGGLFSFNDPLNSALAGAYLNGLAGDNLYKEKNSFYNAEDVVGELGRIWMSYAE